MCIRRTYTPGSTQLPCWPLIGDVIDSAIAMARATTPIAFHRGILSHCDRCSALRYYMHRSRYKSLGGVLGGPRTVVEALLEAVGQQGTLVVPTFTHSGTTHFDPRSSPSLNGAITEAARAHPRAVRSWHPTHAVTAIGPSAADLVRDDLERGALGRVRLPGQGTHDDQRAFNGFCPACSGPAFI